MFVPTKIQTTKTRIIMTTFIQRGIVLTIFLLSLLSFGQRKCGTMDALNNRIKKDHSIIQRMQNSEIKTQKWINEHSNANNKTIEQIVTIPVVVHVLWHTAMENISDKQIQSQIDILNADFSETNSDALPSTHPFYKFSTDTKIQFCLAKRDDIGKATNGITRTYTDTIAYEGGSENVKDPALGGKKVWQPTKYLNIWVCNYGESDLLGFAQFPENLAEDPDTDGVVIRHDAFGNTGTAGSTIKFAENNLGRTATHEVGHWLNLRHIWGDNQPNCGNDFVADTKPAADPNYGCPTFPWNPNNKCGSGSDGEMYMNYMDYGDDKCLNMFTIGQTTRMQAALNNERKELLTSLGCNAPLAVDDFEHEPSIKIYPNPSKGIFSINFNDSTVESYNIVVLDMLGKQLKTLSVSVENSKIDLSELNNGTYLLKVSNSKKSVTQKIIINK